MTIELQNTTITEQSTVTSIVGNVLINTPNSTAFAPMLQWQSGIQPTSITPKRGSLNVQGCFTQGRALRTFSKAELLLSPNPTSMDIHLSVSTGEEGIHTIRIYGTDGSIITQMVFNNSSSMHKEQRVINELPSGVYQVVLQSPSGTQSQKIIVIR